MSYQAMPQAAVYLRKQAVGMSAQLATEPVLTGTIPIQMPFQRRERDLVYYNNRETKPDSRTPALVLNANAPKDLKRKELDDLLARGVDSLPVIHRDQLLELSTHDGARTDEEKVGKIFRTNSFSTGLHDGKSKFQSHFATVSRINHSCRPNCAHFFDPNMFAQNVVAVRGIQRAISGTYRAERPKRLKAWEFKCSCERYSSGRVGSEYHWIQRLWQEVDNYSASSRATPERLISLCEQEGLRSRIQEAYYRAVLEWIGIGEVEKGSEHANLRLCEIRHTAQKIWSSIH
ncbi:hypothetical protein F4801DRAFT_582779 [Xylaria longipes]|nr:hypothetical protein F4801DRAFT_582779 [Xylaria longipes]